ncbi:hypothetical protein ACFWY5_38965 [Nonomuraea sp. NPDC059007]|uniref:hypothetical protein n=1 Tax=Nonomuraea sp. NPDC059007 TaxID=3346692 RepID=UPI00369F8586
MNGLAGMAKPLGGAELGVDGRVCGLGVGWRRGEGLGGYLDGGEVVGGLCCLGFMLRLVDVAPMVEEVVVGDEQRDQDGLGDVAVSEPVFRVTQVQLMARADL